MFKTNELKRVILESGISYAEIDRRMGNTGMAYKYANGIRKATPVMLTKILFAIGWDAQRIRNQRFADWYYLATPADLL